MLVFGYGFFKSDSQSDIVFKYVDGKEVDSGSGKLFFVTPKSTFVRIPTAQRMVTILSTDFTTSDLQSLAINGSIAIVLTPKVKEHHDFTIEIGKGAFIDPKVLGTVEEQVRLKSMEAIQGIIEKKSLREHTNNKTSLAKDIATTVKGLSDHFKDLGVEVKQVFVGSIKAALPKVGEALEAETREDLLAQGDNALSKRNMKNAENQRNYEIYQVETKQDVERKKTELIKLQASNLKDEAMAEAERTKIRLDAYKGHDLVLQLVLAFDKLAEGGVHNLNISSDVINSVKSLVENNSTGGA